jgi:membrane-associated phospholipid phosphatase
LQTADRALLLALPPITLLCTVLMIWVDIPVARYFHEINPQLRHVFKHVTEFGNSLYYLIPFLLLAVALHQAGKRMADAQRGRKMSYWAEVFLFLLMAIAVTGLACDLLKFICGRARPTLLFHDGVYGFFFFEAKGKLASFPSGHAATIAALATALFLIAPKGWKLYLPAAIAVALSRVILSVHYLSDIVAGAYLGIATTMLVQRWFLRRGIPIFSFRPRSNREFHQDHAKHMPGIPH